MLYFLNEALNVRLQKWVPLSMIIALGVLDLANMLGLEKSTTTLGSLVLVALASTYLET